MKALAKPLLVLAVLLFLIGKFHGAVIHAGGSPKGSGASSYHGLSGTLNCAGLEHLWEAAGGSPSTAFLAAEVAKAESGGVQDPPSNASQNSNGKTDVGYWQINSGFHPSLATTDPIGNAKAAIILSNDGKDWSSWVTYQRGLEVGQC